MKRLKRYAEIITIIAVFLGALSAVGIATDGYRPTWAFEHSELREIVIGDLLSRKRIELANLEIIVYNARKRGEQIPQHIIESIVRLKAEIKKLEN